MSWDDHADEWDDNAAVRAYANAAYDSLTGLCDERGFELNNTRACDFGCGTGLLTEKLSSRCGEVIATDTSTKMLEVLNNKIQRLGLSNVRTTGTPIEALVDNQDALFATPFDLIVCSSVCAFLEDYPRTVNTLSRLLQPGGLFVQWDWEFDPSAEDPFGLTKTQIREALLGAGFEHIETRTAFEVAFESQTMKPLVGIGRRRL